MTNIVMLIGPGRYRLTRQGIESLLAHTDQSLTPFTLTFVLDQPDFRTMALVEKVCSDSLPTSSTFLLVGNSGHTLSQLKNLGVAWSEQRWGRGDWLYISDSDVYFTKGNFGQGWLSEMIAMAKTSEMDAGFRLWGGQIHPFHAPVRQIAVDMTEHTILDGPSWMMRWKTWDHYGPFDRSTAPGVCQSEEYPFCQRMQAGASPARIGVLSPHVVIHTGLTHLNGQDAPGRKEREALIPEGVLAQ